MWLTPAWMPLVFLIVGTIGGGMGRPIPSAVWSVSE